MLIKTTAEIKSLIKNGVLIGKILDQLAKMCRPGVSAFAIDQEAEQLIIKAGGRPAFKGYRASPKDLPFPSTICACVNEELVHGAARKEVILKDGDIFSIDIGMLWPSDSRRSVMPKVFKGKRRGMFSDTAVTMPIGEIKPEVKKLIAVTKQALEEGIRAARPGNSVAAIGRAVENYARSQGKYGIVRELVGHGVGHEVHEDPHIPNYYEPKLESVILKPGMVIAIEPMISLGHWKVRTMPDGWTIKMADNSICAHFEHTVVITETGNIVATRRPGEIK